MKTFYSIIILIILSSLTSCEVDKSNLGEVRRNFIVLLDNSRSINDEILAKYIDLCSNTILPNMKHHDRLTIQFIDECVMTRAERIFTLDLDKLDFTSVHDGLNHKEDSINARLSRYLNMTIKPLLYDEIHRMRDERSDCGNYSDIMNGIAQAFTVFTDDKSYSTTKSAIINSAMGNANYEYENIVIIFSDMIQESADHSLDFRKMSDLKPDDVHRIFERALEENEVPDLEGCKIFVNGATSSASGPLANRQIKNIRLFWENYFLKANADLVAYSYDIRKEIENYMTN